MKRVTDFRIDKVEISQAEFMRLPERTLTLIRAYAEFRSSSWTRSAPAGMIRFEIPIYRWEEINATLPERPNTFQHIPTLEVLK